MPQITDRILGSQQSAYEGLPAFSLDANVLAIGASGFDTASGVEVGRVRIYEDDGTAWQLVATLDPPVAYQNLYFGAGVSFGAGDRLVISAPGTSYPVPIQPITYVYERTLSGWTESARLGAWDAANTSDMFGFSAAISAAGNTIVVGSPYRDHSGYTDAGVAHVFERDPATGIWNPSEVLSTVPPDVGVFGWRVAIDAPGDTILVGAPVAGAYGEGAAFVFSRGATGWVETAALSPSLGWWDGYFGFTVALNATGDAAVIGAPQDNDLGMWSGAAFTYRRTASGWVEEAKLHASDGGPIDELGYSVAISAPGDRIYCGGPNASDAGVRQGATYVFDRIGGVWTETAKLIVPNGLQNDGFGAVVACSFDGSRVASAASGDDTAAPNAGAIHIFESPCASPETYCTAKQNSLGCWPVMRFNGYPSAWDGSAFELQAHRVLNQKVGWLVYGVSGRAALPFGGGLLCMTPPARRTPMQSSGGSTTGRDCTGTFSFDFNDWIASEVDPALHVGARVQAQYISRDPAASYGLSLTDAVEFLVEP